MLTRRQFHLRALGLGAAGLGLPALALAQASDYPNRPIKIIVPFAAGGGPDVLTRKMAIKLAEVLGKGSVVIVDNIVGAGGILAAQNVARMAPDGYNLLLGASSHLVQKAMEPSVKFDPMKDFAHITRTAFTPSILVVSATSPYTTVEDLVAAAKKGARQAQLRLRRRRQRGAPVRRGDGAAGEDRRGARALQGLGRNRAVDPQRAPRSSRSRSPRRRFRRSRAARCVRWP